MNSNSGNETAKTILSKTAYLTGSRCRYASYLYVAHPELAQPVGNELILLNGQEFKATALSFMKATYCVDYSENRNTMVEDTLKAIKAGHKRIGNASFLYNGMFCHTDVLVVNDDESLTFYEVTSGSEVKEKNKLDVAYQYVILTSLGYKVKNAFLMHADGEYSFNKGESIDLKQLFVVEDMLDDCVELAPLVKRDVEAIFEAFKTGKAPEHDFSSYCNDSGKCPFMNYCISEAGLPADSNVFNITGPHFAPTKLNKWYYNGIKTYQDMVDNIEVSYKKNGEPKDATWKYVQQAESYLDKTDPPVKKEDLGKFLAGIEYPIASFDYEGFATAVPYYYGLNPSQQIVFQFSYDYIEYEGAERKHYDFLATPGTDPRIGVCKALSKLPKANSILVWNKTYEENRNKEMAKLEGLEEFRDVLLEMVKNMVDLMIPFRERIVYPWNANGSFSLKVITEVLIPNLRYRDLKVHNGTEAAERFLAMPKMTEAEKKKCVQSLKMYNNQDTYGPLKILEKLFRIYKEDDSFVLFKDKTQQDVLKQEIHIGDTVTCDRGIGVIIGFTEKYANVMLMYSSEEVRRQGKSLVLIEEYVTDKSKPRNVRTRFGTLVRDDVVTCNRGIGTVMGFTKCFVRVKLFDGREYLRMRHKLNKIQDAPAPKETDTETK